MVVHDVVELRDASVSHPFVNPSCRRFNTTYSHPTHILPPRSIHLHTPLTMGILDFSASLDNVHGYPASLRSLVGPIICSFGSAARKSKSPDSDSVTPSSLVLDFDSIYQPPRNRSPRLIPSIDQTQGELSVNPGVDTPSSTFPSIEHPLQDRPQLSIPSTDPNQTVAATNPVPELPDTTTTEEQFKSASLPADRDANPLFSIPFPAHTEVDSLTNPAQKLPDTSTPEEPFESASPHADSDTGWSRYMCLPSLTTVYTAAGLAMLGAGFFLNDRYEPDYAKEPTVQDAIATTSVLGYKAAEWTVGTAASVGLTTAKAGLTACTTIVDFIMPNAKRAHAGGRDW